MPKRRSSVSRRRLALILAGLCLLAAVAVAVPNLARLFGDQPFRFNPKAKLKADQTYHLELWVERPNLLAGTAWQEGLEQALGDFALIYPNISVTVTELTSATVESRLTEALASGNPPDLFFSANTPPATISELQLPLSRFVDQTELAAWSADLWRQLQNDKEEVYSLPIAAYPVVMLANSQLLPTTVLQNWQLQPGIWEELIALAETITSKQLVGYVPTSTGETLVRTLAATSGKPAAFDDAGNLIWTENDLVAMADVWVRLANSTGLPQTEASKDANCIDLFLNKKAAIIGPVNHQLADWLWQAAVKKGIEPTILALPTVTTEQWSNLQILGISLFRQATYQGDDHTRAAAELAQQLVPDLGELLSSLTGALPATNVAKAAEWLPYDQDSFRAYSETAHAPQRSYAYGSFGLAELHWQRVIIPNWERLVSGEYGSSQFAEAVLAELALATMTGP